MKRILEAFPNEERELYLCSSDPDSADAIYLKKHKVVFVDGTAPHVFDPKYPGAVQEIINMGDFWNSGRLQSQKEEIIAAHTDYSRYHIRCRRCLSAAAAVLSDTKQIAADALNYPKLDGFIMRLARKLLPQKSAAEGRMIFRQISAITPKGYITLLPENDTVYLLCDSYHSGSDYFLRSLAETVKQKGLTAEISLCTVHEGEHFEHMRIPELALSFISSTPINDISLAEKIPVNFMRFYGKDYLFGKKTRLKFNAAVAKELQGEAEASLASAKLAHDKLEQFYISSVDFDKIERLCDNFIEKIKSAEV
ncbi:MAG: hypothetical protein LUI05_02375 [Oscillospiraceae bacterium]|nr:hypothetical protein [Oscillospiraceae bacterium]